MNFSFPKFIRLRKRRDFQRMTHGSKRFIGKAIVVEMRQSRYPVARLGVTVSRHFGKSHDRNRFKRVVREAFRLSQHDLLTYLDIVVKPGPQAKMAKTQDVIDDLLTCVNMQKIEST